MTNPKRVGLADDQDFADVVAGQEELDGSKIAEEIFDVSVIEDTLQAELAGGTSLFSVTAGDMLHFQSVAAEDVIAVARRIRAGFLGVKESQQHAAGFEQRPQASDYRLHQALVQIVSQVPTQHNIELRAGIDQVFFEEAFAVKSRFPG